MSTVRADNYADRAGTSSIPVATLLQGTAKSWVNFNGSGVVAVRDSFNVSSLLDHAVGDFSILFATARPNANYAMLVCADDNGASSSVGVANPYTGGQSLSASRIRVASSATGRTAYDPSECSHSCLGDPS